MVKNPPAKAGAMGWIPGSGRFLGKGNGNPLQYSCLGNPMDRGAWWAMVMGLQIIRHEHTHVESTAKLREAIVFRVILLNAFKIPLNYIIC